jgi:hypothetical protein
MARICGLNGLNVQWLIDALFELSLYPKRKYCLWGSAPNPGIYFEQRRGEQEKNMAFPFCVCALA